jgi:predicted glycosyltransferase
MKIVIDLQHPADINFFRHAAYSLREAGHEVAFVVLDRGAVWEIACREYPEFPKTRVGKYRKTLPGLMYMALSREMGHLWYLGRKRPDVTAGFGSFLIAFASRCWGIPSVQFYDDYEYQLNFQLAYRTASRLVIPDYIPVAGAHVRKFSGLKELAYLHPNYFQPNPHILGRYQVQPNRYVFVREVANVSLNYRGATAQQLLPTIKVLHQAGTPVLLSIEDKSQISLYAPYATILEEPVEDIHSLLSFAALVLSSGDTVPREAAILGTPSVYTGGRKMRVNQVLVDAELLFEVDEADAVPGRVQELLCSDLKKRAWERAQTLVKERWTDVTQVILSEILAAAEMKKGIGSNETWESNQ